MSSSVLMYNFALLTFNYLMLTTFPIIYVPTTFPLFIFSPSIIVGINFALLLYNVVLLFTLSFLVCQSCNSFETISLVSFCLLMYNLLLVLFNCVLLVYQNLLFIQTILQNQAIKNNFNFN